jgi:hypothetical protein
MVTRSWFDQSGAVVGTLIMFERSNGKGNGGGDGGVGIEQRCETPTVYDKSQS